MRARWNRSPRPIPQVSGSGLCWGTPTTGAARSASHGPGHSTPTSSPPPWPMLVTTPASPLRTPMSSWPRPTASKPWSSTCGTTASARHRWRKRSCSAIELERATRAADPKIRQVSSADYSDSRVEVALASTTGIVSWRRRTNAFLSVDAIAGEGAETQTGTGFSIGRGPANSVPDEAMDDAVLRATRMVGAQKVRSRTARWSSTPVWSRRCWGSSPQPCPARRSSRAVRSSRAGSARRLAPPGSRWWMTRRTPGHTARRRMTAKGWPAGLTCSSPRACCACSCTTPSRHAGPGPCRPDRRPEAASPARPERGAEPRAVAGLNSQDEILATVGDGLYVQSVSGIHSGVNTVSGDFSVGAEGLMIEGAS